MALWPFSSDPSQPVRAVWTDGASSPVLLMGFDRLAPPGEAAAPVFAIQWKNNASDTGQAAPLHRLTRIDFAPWEERLIGSDVTAAYFTLGPASERLPAPPDWMNSWEANALWRPARLGPVDSRWTYLPGAAWLWTSPEWKPATGEQVLFRQRFELSASRRVLQAELIIEADHQLDEAFLNGLPLPWKRLELRGRVVRARVERFLRPGQNLIALSVTAPQTGEIAAAGLAWNLRLILAPLSSPSSSAPFSISSPGASSVSASSRDTASTISLLRTFPFSIGLSDGGDPGGGGGEGGGWVCAQSIELTHTRLLMVRESGAEMEWPRPAVRWIEFWPGNAPKGGVSSRITGLSVSEGRSAISSPSSLPASLPASLPSSPPSSSSGLASSPASSSSITPLGISPISGGFLSLPPESRESEGIWLEDGLFRRGRLEQWSPSAEGDPAADTMRWKGNEVIAGGANPSSAGKMPRIRAALTAPSLGEPRWDFPDADLVRQARILLRDGCLFTCLLEPSAASEIQVTLMGGAAGRFPAKEVVRIDFPAARCLAAQSAIRRLFPSDVAPARIGLIGEAPCRGGPECPEAVWGPLQRIAQALGIEMYWIRPAELVSPAAFSARRFPVLINMDQSEAYYHTVNRPGDGHQALLEYANQGGILIHLVPGTPFYYARQAHARQWALVPLGGRLNRAFGLEIASPGDGSGATGLFETPDNSSEVLEFARVAPKGWSGRLPARIRFPMASDARFRPVSLEPQRQGAQVIPLYRLIRAEGKEGKEGNRQEGKEGNRGGRDGDGRDYGLAAAAARIPIPAAQPGAPESHALPPAAYAIYIAWPLALARDELGDSMLPQILPPLLESIAREREAR